ncbi:lysine-specific demethylase JMJ28-like [Wolffia australiana]
MKSAGKKKRQARGVAVELPPETLRCRRSDGKQWQCTHLAVKGKFHCETHLLQFRRRLRQPPVNLPQCRRTDGKQWRCPRPALKGLSCCELHHRQAALRASRRPVPDSLKLPRAQSRKPISNFNPNSPKKKKKKMPSKELTMELIGMVVRRLLRRREEREKRKREEREVGDGTSPSSSSSSSSVISFENVGSVSSFLRWPFRSKNAEVPLLEQSSHKDVLTGHGGKGKKRACQVCLQSRTQSLVRCWSCRKVHFCMICVKKWYPTVSEFEAKVACPICHGMRASKV